MIFDKARIESWSSELEKIALFGVVLLLAAVGIVLTVPPAEQYEISLYGAYPTYFWSLVVGAMLTGAIVTIGSAMKPKDGNWVFGFLLMIVTNGLLLLMPHIRGYRMYGRADAMTHVGFARDISMSGTIGGNIYPPTHLIVTTVAEATGLPLTTVSMGLPVVFSGIYFGGLFYLLVFMFDSRERILFGLPFVMLPVLGIAHVHLRPFDLSIMLVPLILYLFIKARHHHSMAIRTVFVISLIATVLYHPLTAMFIIGLLGLYIIGRVLPSLRAQYATPTNAVSLSAVVSLVWYVNFSGIILRFNSVYNTLFGFEQGQPPIETYRSTTQQTSIALIDLIRVATFRFGVEFLLFGLGFTFLAVALLLQYRRTYTPTIYTVMIGTALVVFSVSGGAFLLSDLIVPQDRPFQVAKFCAVLLSGQLFYLLWKHMDWSRYRPIIHTGFVTTLGIVLLVLTAVAVLSFFPSPLSAEYNHQVTEMEIDGTVWLTEHGTEETEVREFGIRYYRFYDAQYGREASIPHASAFAPERFNYTYRPYIGQNYQEDKYLILTQRGRVLYPKTFPNYRENWGYTPEDFNRLEVDVTTARVYDNGDFNQYRIDGQQTSALEESVGQERVSPPAIQRARGAELRETPV